MPKFQLCKTKKPISESGKWHRQRHVAGKPLAQTPARIEQQQEGCERRLNVENRSDEINPTVPSYPAPSPNQTKGIRPNLLPLAPRSLTHFPCEQCIVAQIGRFGGSEIPAHTNPFELLSTYQDVQEEDDEQPATPTPKPRRRHRRAKRRKIKWKYKCRQPSDGEEEVSEEAEKEHWCNFIEQLDRAESRAHLPVSPFTDSQSQGNILAGGRAIIGEVAMLVYFDTGCSIDGLMDLKCFKEMVAAGAKWEPSQLPTVKLKSASGHDIECVQAVRTFVVIETPSGPRQAELTFGVMKGKLSLGGLIGICQD
jgi:hypothetical protein